MSLLPFDLPDGPQQAVRDERWARWSAAVARTVRDLFDEWGLVVDGVPSYRHAALIVPVVADSVPAVLKIAGPQWSGLQISGQDDGAPHEILALQAWHGRGAVRLLRADPRRDAMLLERLHQRDLSQLPVLEACEIVAGLYRSLHVAAPPQLVPLTRHVREQTDALAQLPRRAPVPHRVVEQAVHLGRAFESDRDTVGRLIHTDLHYENVLAGDREPWLVVDPQPVSGDPHYEVAPLLRLRWDEVVATGDVRTAVRRRFHTVVDTAELDEDRARDWVVFREAVGAMTAVEEGDPDRVTTAVAIIKAVQE